MDVRRKKLMHSIFCYFFFKLHLKAKYQENNLEEDQDKIIAINNNKLVAKYVKLYQKKNHKDQDISLCNDLKLYHIIEY